MKIDGSFYKTYSASMYNNIERRIEDNIRKNFGLRGDTVEISSDALRMEKVSGYEISRDDRVNELRNEIQSGMYTVNVEGIADKIMGRIA